MGLMLILVFGITAATLTLLVEMMTSKVRQREAAGRRTYPRDLMTSYGLSPTFYVNSRDWSALGDLYE